MSSGRDFEAELRGFLAERIDGLLAAEHRRTHQPRPPQHVNCRCSFEAQSEAFYESVHRVNEAMNRFLGIDLGDPGGDVSMSIPMVAALVHIGCERSGLRAILTRSYARMAWRCSACGFEWTDLVLREARRFEELGIGHQVVPESFAREARDLAMTRPGAFPDSFPSVPVERPPIGPIPPHIRRELRNRVLEIPEGIKRAAPPSDRLPIYRPT